LNGLERDPPKTNGSCALLELKLQGLFNVDSFIAGDISLDILVRLFWTQLTENFQHVMMLFQQDKAPPHYHRDARQSFDDHLPGLWIGR
jgi:hypothetical protein